MEIAGALAGIDRLDQVADLRDEDRGGDLAGVAAALAALGADDVDASLDGLDYVLRGADHVHDRDARGVELVHGELRRDADGRDEDGRALLDDHVDQLRELALRVVLVGLAGGAADLGEEEVDAPRRRLVDEALLDLLALVAEVVDGGADAADDAQAALVGDSGGELGARGDVHAGEEDRLGEAEELLRAATKKAGEVSPRVRGPATMSWRATVGTSWHIGAMKKEASGKRDAWQAAAYRNRGGNVLGRHDWLRTRQRGGVSRA